MKKRALLKLLEMAGPAPAQWVTRYGWVGLKGFKKVDGLAVPQEVTSWSKRCVRNPMLPWALWSALRALGVEEFAEENKGEVPVVTPGKPSGALARVDFRPSGRDTQVVVVLTGGVKVEGEEKLYRLRLGKLGEEEKRILVPGLTLEETLYGKSKDFDRMILEQSLEKTMKAEAAIAAGWIKGDKVLGLSVLLGRLYAELGEMESTLKRRRAGGYLDDDYSLNEAGWWRLAYLAAQGVGEVESRRWRWLQQIAGRIDRRTGRLGRYRHLQLTQSLAVRLLEERGAIPLGVEYSASGKLIAKKSPHAMKADVLMVDAKDGHLIWGEILRRPEKELSWRSERGGFMTRQPGDRYKRMREDVLPWLASALEQEVELVLQEPSGTTTTLYLPEKARERARLEELAKERWVEEAKAAEVEKARQASLLEDEWDY